MSESRALEPVADHRVASLELVHAQQQLREADAALGELTVQRDEARQALADTRTRVEALTVQLDTQRSVAANAARERDDYGMRLIDAEQRAAALSRRPGAMSPEALQRRVAELEDELVFIRRTVSWRLTEPLRSLRTAISRRIER
jgi:chromosome segregation ATPase